MPDDVFRIVVAGGVLLACLAFIVQAAVAIAFYRVARKAQERLDHISRTVDPVVAKAGPVFDRLLPVIEHVEPIVEQVVPMMERAGKAMEQIGPAAQKIGAVADSARATLLTANRIMDETRPKIAEVSDQVAAITRTGREQVERVGTLLHDASARARHRLEQIDDSVESTVEQVQQVGDSMKRAVLRPVREVNGLAAGISAAVSSLVKGRKSSVDSATLDEEMFI